MKRTALLLVLLLFLVFPVCKAQECQSPIQPSDIPCQIITTWQYPAPCNQYTVKIYNSTPELLQELTLTNYSGTGRCNQTFNISTRGSYILNFSTGDSASIIVGGYKMEFFRLSVFAFFFLIGLVLLSFMHKYKEDVGSSLAYGVFSATIMFIMGSMILFGFDVIVTDINFVFNLNTYLALICYMIGLYTTWYGFSLYSFVKKESDKARRRIEEFE